MKRLLYFSPGRSGLLPLFLGWFATLTLVLTAENNAYANVYATNIRLNGGATNVIVPPGGNITISYILNEPATAGVLIQIKSGLNTLRTIGLTNEPGTVRGTNAVVWDGKDNASNTVPAGNYSVQITAAAEGHADWTQISDDADLGGYVFQPRGIAVNKNPNSPYYGRVFVGNSSVGVNPAANPGDRIGFQKLNADGSPAAEGSFSDGGWAWGDDTLSPWKIEVADDDRVYVNDWIANGVVLSFNQTLSTNSRLAVLRSDNWPNLSVNFSGPFVSGSGTNAAVWMADITSPGGVGIRRWSISTNGVIATNDLGVTVVPSGGGSDLNLYPFDIALDGSNAIYTIQYSKQPGDPAYRVLRFPNLSPPVTLADWKIGTADDTMGGAHGIAVDPSGTYVAVAFQGVFSGTWQNSSARVFYASNGASVAIPTVNRPGDYRDVAWDNVGNLYVIDSSLSLTDSGWRVYSPPGTNSATTVSSVNINFGNPTPAAPVLSEPAYTNGQFRCVLTGQPNVVYYLEASTNLQTWTVVATNVSPLARREISVPAPNDRSSYRAFAGQASSSAVRPLLSQPSYSAGQFHFTLTGEANVSYIIQASDNLSNWTAVATNTAAASTRQINVNAPGGRNFYRALRSP